MVIPSLMYRAEMWVLTKKQQRVEVVGTELLRNVAGYTLMDQIRNTAR
jgi:hypothetical protein